MRPYDPTNTAAAGSTAGSSASSSSSSLDKHPPPATDLDGLLAGAGYKVRSSELRHVAQRLERLETAMADSADMSGGAALYNPSDLATWVDSLLSEFEQHPSEFADFPDLFSDHPTAGSEQYQSWSAPHPHGDVPFHHAASTPVTEEDSGIRLVHALVTCAEAVQRGDLPVAGSLIENMQSLLMTRVSVDRGIGKVAGYFIDALSRRILGTGGIGICAPSGYENEVLYHHFYEACPYLKFAHFTANQAILEAFDGHDSVHVIDFNLMHGLQWPALIQALALRPGGPPFLRLTGIGPPPPDGRDSLREIGLRLAQLARSVNVRFAFRGVAAARLEDVEPWMLHVSSAEANEAVAVNSVMQLHRLITDQNPSPPIEAVLGWIRDLNPKIVTVVEQEANHNQSGFLDRFTESLYYYSTMFDSLEACQLQPEKTLAEMYIQREICNVVCCEGSARLERHEPLDKWRGRLGRAGFKPMNLGLNAFKQASMLLTLFSAEGYCVEEREGSLTLGWHSRPLIAASAWQPISDSNY